MPDRKKVISTFEKRISLCKEDGCDFIDLTFEDAEQILSLLKKQEDKQIKKSKEEVLLAIIGKQSYTDLEKFKQLEELNDEYYDGMLDSIRAVEKLFDNH